MFYVQHRDQCEVPNFVDVANEPQTLLVALIRFDVSKKYPYTLIGQICWTVHRNLATYVHYTFVGKVPAIAQLGGSDDSSGGGSGGSAGGDSNKIERVPVDIIWNYRRSTPKEEEKEEAGTWDSRESGAEEAENTEQYLNIYWWTQQPIVFQRVACITMHSSEGGAITSPLLHHTPQLVDYLCGQSFNNDRERWLTFVYAYRNEYAARTTVCLTNGQRLDVLADVAAAAQPLPLDTVRDPVHIVPHSNRLARGVAGAAAAATTTAAAAAAASATSGKTTTALRRQATTTTVVRRAAAAAAAISSASSSSSSPASASTISGVFSGDRGIVLSSDTTVNRAADAIASATAESSAAFPSLSSSSKKSITKAGQQKRTTKAKSVTATSNQSAAATPLASSVISNVSGVRAQVPNRYRSTSSTSASFPIEESPTTVTDLSGSVSAAAAAASMPKRRRVTTAVTVATDPQSTAAN